MSVPVAKPVELALAGKRVLVTRPGERGKRLAGVLEGLGAESVTVPTIEFAPPADPRPLGEAARRLDMYDWVVFTSPRAVEAMRASLSDQSLVWPSAARCAVVGPATRAVLEEAGATIDAQADEARSAAVIGALGDVHGKRILLPRSDLADPAAADELRASGAQVDEVEAYRTRFRSPTAAETAVLRLGYDAVVFASGSAVLGYLREVAPIRRAGSAEPAVVCIGQATAEAARKAGLEVAEVAAEPTDAGLARAVVAAVAG